MSLSRDPAGLLDRVSLSSPQQRGLRAAVPVATLLFGVLVRLSTGQLHPVLAVGALLLSVMVALLPDSNAGLSLVVYLGAFWVLVEPVRLDAWTLAAALLLWVVHLACTLASYGPPGLTLDPGLLRLWRSRSLACLAVAVLVWGAGLLVGAVDLGASRLALGLGLVLVVCWGGVVRMVLGRPDPGSGD